MVNPAGRQVSTLEKKSDVVKLRPVQGRKKKSSAMLQYLPTVWLARLGLLFVCVLAARFILKASPGGL